MCQDPSLPPPFSPFLSYRPPDLPHHGDWNRFNQKSPISKGWSGVIAWNKDSSILPTDFVFKIASIVPAWHKSEVHNAWRSRQVQKYDRCVHELQEPLYLFLFFKSIELSPFFNSFSTDPASMSTWFSSDPTQIQFPLLPLAILHNSILFLFHLSSIVSPVFKTAEYDAFSPFKLVMIALPFEAVRSNG